MVVELPIKPNKKSLTDGRATDNTGLAKVEVQPFNFLIVTYSFIALKL